MATLWTSGNTFFTKRMTEPWHRLSRKIVESPCLEVFRSHWDMVLGNQLWVALFEQRVGPHDLQRPTSVPLILWSCDQQILIYPADHFKNKRTFISKLSPFPEALLHEEESSLNACHFQYLLHFMFHFLYDSFETLQKYSSS